MGNVTASKAALLGACAFPFREGSCWEETKGKAAVDGDAFHHLIAPVVETLKGELPEKCTLWMKRRMIQATAWVAKNHVPGWRAEVAYAYDPITGKGRILGYDIGRKYEEHGRLPNEIAGSADIAWLSGDTIEIRDWKTGRTVGASCQAQMEWLSLFAARATGAWNAHAVALHVTEAGVDETSAWFFDDVALWRIGEQLRIDVSSIDDAWPVTGTHCDNCYCPTRAGCDLYQISKRQSA